jgi:hypothetical protein
MLWCSLARAGAWSYYPYCFTFRMENGWWRTKLVSFRFTSFTNCFDLNFNYLIYVSRFPCTPLDRILSSSFIYGCSRSQMWCGMSRVGRAEALNSIVKANWLCDVRPYPRPQVPPAPSTYGRAFVFWSWKMAKIRPMTYIYCCIVDSGRFVPWMRPCGLGADAPDLSFFLNEVRSIFVLYQIHIIFMFVIDLSSNQ